MRPIAWALIGLTLGLGLGHIEPTSAENSLGVNLDTFCPNGSTASPVAFLHDDDSQRVNWIYYCIDQDGASVPVVPR